MSMSLGLHNFVQEINGWCWSSKSMSLFSISLEHWACNSGPGLDLVGLGLAGLGWWAAAASAAGWIGEILWCCAVWLGLGWILVLKHLAGCPADRWAGLSFQKGLDVSTSKTMGWLDNNQVSFPQRPKAKRPLIMSIWSTIVFFHFTWAWHDYGFQFM